MMGDRPPLTEAGGASGLTRVWEAYRMRWKRRRLLLRALRKLSDLQPVTPYAKPARGAILAFATMRDEALRLPFWLEHYRRLGVDRFVIVDNGSTDGTGDLLAGASDVALWRTPASYRAARFGMDWLGALQHRLAPGHWCVTVDADEVLIYPHWQDRPLGMLAGELERRGALALGALMIELYPRGPLSQTPYRAGDDPVVALPFLDPGGYRARRQRPARNLWVQGGPRDRMFFAHAPGRAPTLNKLPFVRWRRGQVWLNSTHAALPPRLNLAWDGPGDRRLSGALLHTKFLPDIVDRSSDPRHRAAHFGDPAVFDGYHDALVRDPDLWWPGAARYGGWEHLEALGLLSADGW